ncbi:50S ribosomal protein L4 [Picrophilus oshimae]|uniref:Large ribosomal subunit protein uL4 n=1 Tax=Picrophilus torridus (strain ATCC 700027 / DSM 9790 / JCM 10055 / NBRC 100828 / KAW 2/3) TaxID=1122961 RepID=A0A8G2FVZ7_PICTO|nr:50S ribosomal protein L4 [Picrophilus oshimae]SMD30469.1 LSU ribosomal protein L4P [Picrophilus oshimae DSM 9789]
MKANIYDLNGEIKGEMELPKIFEIRPREDILREAFRAITLSYRQPYGASPDAGMRRVGQNLGPNHGISRIPRLAGGSRAVLLGSVVGGKSAHAPRSDKVLYKKINKRERKLARFTAIALTASREHIIKRGHRIDEDSNLTFPVIVTNDLEKIKKTRDAVEFFKKLGLYDDILRSKENKKIRPGRGKMRNRTYKQPKSLLIVGTSYDNLKAFSSLPGVDIATPSSLSIRKLAPGGTGGRLTIFTESAISSLKEVQ